MLTLPTRLRDQSAKCPCPSVHVVQSPRVEETRLRVWDCARERPRQREGALRYSSTQVWMEIAKSLGMNHPGVIFRGPPAKPVASPSTGRKLLEQEDSKIQVMRPNRLWSQSCSAPFQKCLNHRLQNAPAVSKQLAFQKKKKKKKPQECVPGM